MARHPQRDSDLPSLPPKRSKARKDDSAKSKSAGRATARPRQSAGNLGVLWLVIAGVIAVPLLAFGVWLVWPKDISSRADIESAQHEVKMKELASKHPDEAIFLKLEGNVVHAERESSFGKRPLEIPVGADMLPRWACAKPGLKFHVRAMSASNTLITYRDKQEVARSDFYYEFPDLDRYLPPADPQVLADYERPLAVARAAWNRTEDQNPPENAESSLLLALCWPEREGYIASAKLPIGVEKFYRESQIDTRVKVAGWLKSRPDIKPEDYQPGVLAVFASENENTMPGDYWFESTCQFLDSLPQDDLVQLLLSEHAAKIPLSLKRTVTYQLQKRTPKGKGHWLANLQGDPRAETFMRKFVEQIPVP